MKAQPEGVDVSIMSRINGKAISLETTNFIGLRCGPVASCKGSCVHHVNEALWMEDVVRVDHIQAIHSQRPVLRFMKLPGGELHWELWEPSNPTQMLSYDQWIFISIHGWSSKRAWSWWLASLALPLGRKKVGIRFPPLASSLPQFIP